MKSKKEIAYIQLLTSGDRSDFKQFYDAFASKVYNTALGYVKNVQDAEEITQDVFVQLVHSAEKFQGNSSIQTWVYRITVNKSLDFIRKQKAKKRFAFFGSTSTEEIHQVGDFNHPGIIAENKESAKLLFTVIDSLSEHQKTAFILSYVEALPRAEVALIMDTSLKSVESLLQRAKKNLRALLENHYPNRRK